MPTTSTCVKCNATEFELVEIRLNGASHAHYAARCARCGGVISIQEIYNLSSMLKQQNAALKLLAARAGVPVQLDT